MKVLLNATLGKAQLQKWLADKLAGQGIWVEDADAAIRELRSADAMICPDHFYSAKLADAVRTAAPSLRWIQLLSAGYDHTMRHGVPPHITLCNAGQAYAPAVATHARLCCVQRRPPTACPSVSHVWDRASRRSSPRRRQHIAVIGFVPSVARSDGCSAAAPRGRCHPPRLAG